MNSKTAIKVLIWLLAAIIIFHLCIILKIVPYDIAWGGRLKSDTEMYVFETISVVINLFLGVVVLIKGNYMRQIIPSKIVTIILWAFLILFGINTIGNIFAKTNFEKSFALLTLTLSILIWVILKSKDKTKDNPL